MTYYFISDNSWFLQGLALSLKESHPDTKVVLIHTDRLVRLVPDSGDVIVVNINDITVRRRILKRPVMTICRVVLLLPPWVIGVSAAESAFPWLIPDNLRINDLMLCLFRAEKTSVRNKMITERERVLFHCLGNGQGIESLSSRIGVTAKSIYLLRKNILTKYGLSGSHPFALLVCRDITGMKRQSAYIRHNTGRRNRNELHGTVFAGSW